MATRPARHALRVGAPLGGLALLLVLPSQPSGAGAADVVTAAVMLACGSIALLVDRPRQGALAMLGAVALVIVARTNPQTSAPTVQMLTIVAAPLIVPFAAGAIGGRGAWWRAAIVGGVAAGALRALVYDPFRDAGCVGCRHNPAVLAHHLDLARGLLVGGVATTTLALVMLAVRSPRRWTTLAVAIAGVAMWWFPDARAVAGAMAAIVMVDDMLRSAAAQHRVLQLVRVLHDGADLGATLRRMLGDPGLTVAYWLPAEQRFAASGGGPDVSPSAAQITTELTIGTEIVAVIRHDPDAVEVLALSRALDGPARLALENERLTVQLASQERQLQHSRARIVARGDVERRLLERDVHDGAQQHVLALGFDLRTALGHGPSDDVNRPVLERCLGETMAALDELRDLSHGLYPPSLEAGGLSAALQALARRAEFAVSIGQVPQARLPAQVERTVFALVADSTVGARCDLTVEIDVDEPNVEVRICGANVTCGQTVADRVAALAGTLRRTIDSTGSTLQAVIPCVS
jgi:signal transduction histidine kinase